MNHNAVCIVKLRDACQLQINLTGLPICISLNVSIFADLIGIRGVAQPG